jgi:hypothetical protein
VQWWSEEQQGDDTLVLMRSPAPIPLGSFTHIAVTRTHITVELLVNGAVVKTDIAFFEGKSLPDAPMLIGCDIEKGTRNRPLAVAAQCPCYCQPLSVAHLPVWHYTCPHGLCDAVFDPYRGVGLGVLWPDVCPASPAPMASSSASATDWGIGPFQPARPFSGCIAQVALWSSLSPVSPGGRTTPIHGSEPGLCGLWRLLSVPDPCVDASPRAAHGVFRSHATLKPRSATPCLVLLALCVHFPLCCASATSVLCIVRRVDVM